MLSQDAWGYNGGISAGTNRNGSSPPAQARTAVNPIRITSNANLLIRRSREWLPGLDHRPSTRLYVARSKRGKWQRGRGIPVRQLSVLEDEHDGRGGLGGSFAPPIAACRRTASRIRLAAYR
jgi:hypothetical protein